MLGTQCNEFDNLIVKFEMTTLIRKKLWGGQTSYMEHYVTDWTVLMFLQCGNYNLETSAWLTFDTEH